MKILTLQEVDPMGMGVGRRTTDRPWEIKAYEEHEKKLAKHDFEVMPHELEFFDNLAKSTPLENVVGRSIPLSEYRVGDKVRILYGSLNGQTAEIVNCTDGGVTTRLACGELDNWGYAESLELVERAQRRAFEVGDRVSIKSKGKGSMGGTLGTVAEVDEAKKWLWLALDDGSSGGTRPGLWSVFASDCENLTPLR